MIPGQGVSPMYPAQYFNPMINPQQRLNQMEQQYQGYTNPVQQQYPQQQTMVLRGRAVSSFEEVRAAMIDLDGSMFVFTDVANRKIYTKQINLDGTASLNTYSLEEPKVTPETSTVSVTRDELDMVINNFNQEIAALKLKFDCREEPTNVSRNEPNANDGPNVTKRK